MSIRPEWQKLLAEGVLSPIQPFWGDAHARTVLVSGELHALLREPWEDSERGNRCARLLATLQAIVAGRQLVVCLTPYQARKAMMGRLHPLNDGIWDIRCQDRPALRVFCAFLERDVIVAFTCSPRSKAVDWIDRPPLGKGNSTEWRRAIADAKREWAKIFPAYRPVTGDYLNDYLTNAVHE